MQVSTNNTKDTQDKSEHPKMYNFHKLNCTRDSYLVAGRKNRIGKHLCFLSFFVYFKKKTRRIP